MNAARAPLETPVGPPPDSSPGGAWTAASLTPPALPPGGRAPAPRGAYRRTLLGGLVLLISACTAGTYDLPACLDKEICGNGFDDDCDGIKDNPDFCNCAKIDERRPCPPRAGIVTNTVNPLSICTNEEQICLPNMQWSSCKGIDPIIEKCGNGRDDDCDGGVDDQDPEGCIKCVDGETQTLTNPNLTYGPKSICKAEVQDCKAGTWVTRPGFAAVGPRSSDATCDGFDDDCDGSVDEDATWQGLPLGADCSDDQEKGVCRSVGTVSCLGGVTTCIHVPRTPDRTNFYRIPSANVYKDASAPNADWDWDCSGTIDKFFSVGNSTTQIQSNITKPIYVVLDQSTGCSIAKPGNFCNAVVIQPKVAGEFIQCGTAVTVIECDFIALPPSCANRPNPQSGYTYCR